MHGKAVLYLRTALFTVPATAGLVSAPADGGLAPHVPPGTLIAVVEVLGTHATHLEVRVRACHDGRGKLLAEVDRRLWIPWDKVDHVHPEAEGGP